MHDIGMFWFWWFGDVLKWFGNAESQCVKLCLAQEKAGIEFQLKFSPTRFQKCARLELCKRHLAQTVWSGEVRLPAAQLKWDVIRVSRNISRFNHNNTTTQHQDWQEKDQLYKLSLLLKIKFLFVTYHKNDHSSRTDRHFRVPCSGHRALVDIGAAHDDVWIVHNHHFAKN